ncbi:hypothetical protein Patl1_29562 [Pistacia atlantica]|uniref:Uncharacterized protein n=1 Tax=Pistacia atlantica TaxID=434234 RepID=A0ACC1ADB2_9ROSI|nr:hypothetical protein Patl1_29562 [Pistacia atlantica]
MRTLLINKRWKKTTGEMSQKCRNLNLNQRSPCMH